MLKIVSGGQTGVDRAALDVAIEQGVTYRGWCPKGGWAEDMPDPPGVLAEYPGLRETPGSDPLQRTEWNVRDSDRLMVLVDGARFSISKGTAFVVHCAETLGKPHVVIDLGASDAGARAAAFLGEGQGALALNIAGPRESEAPGIYAKAEGFLRRLLASRA
jgi:hypothetical protein